MFVLGSGNKIPGTDQFYSERFMTNKRKTQKMYLNLPVKRILLNQTETVPRKISQNRNKG